MDRMDRRVKMRFLGKKKNNFFKKVFKTPFFGIHPTVFYTKYIYIYDVFSI
jgi:hypothetical protein